MRPLKDNTSHLLIIKSVNVESEVHRLRATVPGGYDETRIHLMEKDELMVLQKHFGLGDVWGTIRLPQEWHTAGKRKSTYTYNIRFSYRHCALTTEDLELAVLVTARMFLLCLCGSSPGIMNRGTFLSPRTLMGFAKFEWKKLIVKALKAPQSEDGKLLSRLRREDLKDDVDCLRELKRFSRLASISFWTDVPTWQTVDLKVEESNKGDTLAPSPPPKSNPFQPLPDKFVHLTGQRATWIVEHLTETLLDAWNNLILIRRANAGDRYALSKECCAYLAEYRWINARGETIDDLPFELNSEVEFYASRKSQYRYKPQLQCWPPTNWVQFCEAIKLVQMANFFIIGLSTGPRVSETLSFTTHSVKESPSGIALIKGRTWKISDVVEGETRDWPLPSIAMHAAVNQQGLSYMAALEQDPTLQLEDARHQEFPLWWNISQNGITGRMTNEWANANLRQFVHIIGTSHLLDDIAFTNHRFRKTIARLIAIAFVHSPKILQDIFGHKALEMTMSYILTDPQIVADMREAREELVRMMAREAIQNVDDLGGPGAENVRQAVHIVKMRMMGNYGAQDEDELVEMLTHGGRTWTKPRDAVICTRARGEAGPCAVGTKVINTANCQETCSSRIELPAARAQAETAIKRCIEKIIHFQISNDPIFVENWEDRLLKNLERFGDLKSKWASHPIVAAALHSSQATMEATVD